MGRTFECLGPLFGGLLGLWYAQTKPSRFVKELDARLNLPYLIERLCAEKEMVAAYVGAAPVKSELLFSIVVPIYQIPLLYVKALVQSLRAQRYANWELCVCDDGDADPTVRDFLLAEVQGKLRLLCHPENRGIAAATRSALALAQGDVICFVDADDELHADALLALAAKFSEHEELDAVYTDHDLLTDWGFRISPYRKPAYSPELLFSCNYVNHLLAVRRSCLLRAPEAFSDDTSGAQDWDLCLRLLRVARRVGHVPLVLYHWRQRPGSVALSPLEKPWMIKSAQRVQERQLLCTDPRLELFYEGKHGPAIRFRKGVRPPPLLYVRLRANFDTQPMRKASYTGPQRVLEIDFPLGASSNELLALLDDRLSQRLKKIAPGTVLLFEYTDIPELLPLVGDLERMAAYCQQPGVGCVWPFRNGSLRLAYTLEHDGRRLTQLAMPRSPYSNLSGNVLTGPLHGMMVRANVLKKLGGFAGATRHLEGFGELNFPGAALGLFCLSSGLRNVAARGVTSQSELEPVFLGNSAPPFDPYI